MKILIDLQACQSGSRHGGIGRYSMNLVQGILRNNTEHEVYILLNGLFQDTINDVKKELVNLIAMKNILIFDAIGPVAAANEDAKVNIQVSELLREYFICQVNPDVLFILSFIEGLGDDVISSIHNIFPKEKTFVVLYDLIPLVEKDKYLTTELTKRHYYKKIEHLQRANKLLAISQFSKEEGELLLGYDSNRIVNISSAVDSKFKKVDISQKVKFRIYKKFNIEDKFLLYTGSFDNRKNHEKLIEAYSLLPSEIRNDLQIVIVGNGWPEIYAHLHWIASNFNIDKTRIIFTGKVNDDELLLLYNLTDLFVFPSLREGFGLPVLEAMQCQVPVIGSNTTSIPEVIGNSNALFSPTDAKAISDKIYQGLTDQLFRQELIQNNSNQVKKFSWDLTGKRALKSFESLTKYSKKSILFEDFIKKMSKVFISNNIDENYLYKVSNAMHKNSLYLYDRFESQKIAMITTWNSRCGIAEYSKHIIGDNIESYHIYAPRNENLEHNDTDNVSRCWNFEDDLIYLKNQLISDGISKILIQFNYGFFEFQYLLKFIIDLKELNFRIYITMHATTDPDSNFFLNKKLASICNGLALCDKVFVHSEKDIDRLKLINLKDNVELFPQGIVTKKVEKIPLNIDKTSFVIATYGFLLPHKGYKEFIESFKLILDKGINVHLIMVNALYDNVESNILLTEIEKLVTKYKINDRVTLITDFLDDEKSIGYLKNADIVLYPFIATTESSSASVRMGLNSERLVVTTPLDIFDDVKDLTYTLGNKNIAEELIGLHYDLKNHNVRIKNVLDKAIQWKEIHSYATLSNKILNIIKPFYKE